MRRYEIVRTAPRVAGAFLLLSLVPLWSNWGGESGGSVASGTFRPFGTSQVEMREEKLGVQLYRSSAKVRVDYVLVNTGDAVDVRAGFLCLELAGEDHRGLEIQNYQLTADGKPVPYRMELGDVRHWLRLFDSDFLGMMPGVDIDANGKHVPCRICVLRWLASKVHFDRAQTRRVAIQYESPYEFSDGGYSADGIYNDDYFRYILSTGAAWKGPIGKGTVAIQAVSIDPKLLTVKPEGRFQRTLDGFAWAFENLKPSVADDIEVRMHTGFYTIHDYEHPDNPPDDSLAHVRNDGQYSFEENNYFHEFHDYAVEASSEKGDNFAAWVGDFDPRTAWVTDRNGGVGESLTLTLRTPQRVDQIGIMPGYAKSKALYFANNRVRHLEIAVNGTHTVTADLPDEFLAGDAWSKKGYRLIDLGDYAGPARTIKLTVKQIYRGSAYNDLCISEILLRKRLKNKPNPPRAG